MLLDNRVLVAFASLTSVVLAIAWTSDSASADAPGTPKQTLLVMNCASDVNNLAAQIKTAFDEDPIASSHGTVPIARSNEISEVPVTTIMFANTETLSVTNVALFEDGSACVLNTGLDFKPIENGKDDVKKELQWIR